MKYRIIRHESHYDLEMDTIEKGWSLIKSFNYKELVDIFLQDIKQGVRDKRGIFISHTVEEIEI